MSAILDHLNDKQEEAVLHFEGPLLILAGAGSGKTRVLTHRIAYLIEEHQVNPWQILALTFTNKAASEMRERVDQIVSYGAESIWVSTFHSTCVRILRRYIDLIGYSRSFTIYDTDDQKSLMKDICKHLNIDTKKYKEKTFLNAISNAKNELKTPEQFAEEVEKEYNRRIFGTVYKEYQKRLKQNNALDFDDLIMKTVELFKDQPQVLEHYQNRFRFILVDEYQDTNTAQFMLLSLLASRYRNLCVVGDDDQSIYKFRGANIRNILDFEKYFPEAAVIKLERNYRSTQSILDAANAVISNNESRKDKALWTDKGAGSLVHFRQFDNAYEEAEYIADEIAREVKRKNVEYRDHAVLYRTNAQARLLEERMIMESVPYNVVGGTNFYARAEIKDILAYLKTIDNGRDEVAVRRIINVPKRGVGNATLEKLEDFAEMKNMGLYEAMEQADDIMSLGKAAAKIKPFVFLIQNFRNHLEEYTIAELIKEIVEKIEYAEYLQNNDEESAEDRLANVDELITKAVNYQETHEDPSLTEFLEEVALVADIDNVNSDDNRVLLMTLHSAKGLEFPHVYLAGMEDGLFPSYMNIASDDPSDVEEERRLAYVGITRAMDELTLTCARMRMTRGETQYNPVSRFVREIPTELMDNTVPTPKSIPKDTLSDLMGLPKEPSGAYDFRPKAINRPKAAVKADKPFIAKGIGSLNQIAGLSKGAPSQPAAELAFGVGDRVSHIKYGEGTVLNIAKEPRDYKVTVSFDKAGQKIMYASFAKLKRL